MRIGEKSKQNKSEIQSRFDQATTSQGAFSSVTKTEAMMTHGKDPKQAPGNVGMVGGRTGRVKNVLRFGYDDASESAESGSRSSSEASDEEADQLDSTAINKRSFSQMLADVSTSRNPTSPIPAASLKSEVDLWNALSTRTEPRPGLISAASPSVTMVGYEGMGLHQRQFTQSQEDERQLKQLKRKQSNRESARRSKLRKQVECEKLQTKVDKMKGENNVIKDEINKLAKELDVLKSENNNIMDELTQNYKYSGGIPTLQINNFVPQSEDDEDNLESSRTRDLFKCHGNFTL